MTDETQLPRHLIEPIKTSDEIGRFVAPLPPFELQQRFSRFFAGIQKVTAKQSQSAQQINELFHSLMHKAFRGELAQANIAP